MGSIAVLVLQTATVVAKSLPVTLVVRRDRLHLSLESVVDALALVDGVQALWTRDGLHGEVRTHRHTLVNVAS